MNGGQKRLTFTASFLTITAMPRRNTNELHGEIPIAFVRMLSDYLKAHNRRLSDCLDVDIARSDNHFRLPAQQWQSCLQQVSDELKDPFLGLNLGQSMTVQHLGVMGYVLLSCPNLGAALQRLERYQRLLYDLNPMQQHITGNHIRLQWGTEYGRPGALMDETAVTALVQIARDITGHDVPVSSVSFVNERPKTTAPYESFFGGKLQFESSRTEVVFPIALLSLPLRQPDANLLGMLETQAEQLLSELSPETSELAHAVRREILRQTPEGKGSIDDIAQALHFSPRTLHRKLLAEGLRYRALRESALTELANRHLQDKGLTIAEVALLLGYSEQSAFTRAYKGWTGLTPRQQRLRGSDSFRL